MRNYHMGIFYFVRVLLRIIRTDIIEKISEKARYSKQGRSQSLSKNKSNPFCIPFIITAPILHKTKPTKTIKEKDILIIRGKGKFIVDEFLGKNKKDKEIIKIKKYK